MKNTVCCALAVLLLSFESVWAQPAPTLSLSVDGQETVRAYRGWPLLVRLEIFNETLMLDPADTNTQLIALNPWTAAITLQIADPTGAAIHPPLTPANSPTGTLALTAESGGETGWWLTPEATTNLAPGVYTLRALLNTTNAGAGWQGIAASRAVTIILSDEPASPPAESVSEKLLRGADYAVWSGDLPRANNLIDQLVSLQPTNVTALARKGDLLAFAGQDRQALDFYQFALQAYSFRHSDDPDAEPPEALLKRRRAVLAKVAFAPDAGHLLLTLRRSAQGEIALEWPTVPGKPYTLESTLDLKTWQVAAAGLVAETNRITWTTNSPGPARFYRVITADN